MRAYFIIWRREGETIKLMPRIVFKAKGYLEKSYLDKDGAKHATFEFNVSDALEIAKLELMGRDIKNHLPILLDITVRQANDKTQGSKGFTKSRATSQILYSRELAKKDKRVF